MLSGGDKDFVTKMVNLFLDQTPDLMIRMKKGAEEQNLKEVKLSAHKMISSISMMNIEDLKNPVREIEEMAERGEDSSGIKRKVFVLDQSMNEVVSQIRQDFESVRIN